MANVTVLGGGISGLATAYYLLKQGSNRISKITVLEASKRTGGWIQTRKNEDGCLRELGPRTLRVMGAPGLNTLKLAEDLGLEQDILPVTKDHPAAMNRYIYAKGRLNKLPNSFWGLMKKNSLFKLPLMSYMIREPFRPANKGIEDDSVHNFVSRRLGKEVADYAADPLVRGIFAGDARKLSMKSCFRPVFDMEQKYGSILRGAYKERKAPGPATNSSLGERSRQEKWAVWSLKGGLQQLSDRLTQYLTDNNVDIITKSPCTGIDFVNDKVKVKTTKQVYECDHVVSSLYAKDLAGLLPNSYGELSQSLSEIPSVHTAVVNLQYKGDVLPVQGFGHLVPSVEPSKILGVIYDSHCFPDHQTNDVTRLTAMMGGDWFEELFGDVDNVKFHDLENAAVEGVREQLNIKDDPVHCYVHLNKTHGQTRGLLRARSQGMQSRRCYCTETPKVPEIDPILGRTIYEGTVGSMVRAVKSFSLSTSIIGLALQPYIYLSAEQLGKFQIVFSGICSVIIFGTPVMLHFMTKKYVTKLYYNDITKEFTAETISFFLRRIRTTYKVDDVHVPDIPGLFTTFVAKGVPLFVDMKFFNDIGLYKHMMGFDKPLEWTFPEEIQEFQRQERERKRKLKEQDESKE